MVERTVCGVVVDSADFSLFTRQPPFQSGIRMLNLTQDIVLSSQVLSELLDSFESDIKVDFAMRCSVNEITNRARIFISRFENCYFLIEEPIHEFVGLEFRDTVTSKLIEVVKYRMIIRPERITVYTPEEIPLDELYDIRHVIAESQLPEFYNDHFEPTDSGPDSEANTSGI